MTQLLQHLSIRNKINFLLCLIVPCMFFSVSNIHASDAVYKSRVKPLLDKYCIDCHGPKKSKGDISLDALDADMKLEQDLKHWEKVLVAIQAGEMPPEEEKQPSAAEKKIISEWINNGLKEFIANASSRETAPTLRRLTNFEYQNTMRDLLGINMDFTQGFPSDPLKNYHFNNTARYMKLGVDMLTVYEKAARRALDSVIVNPKEKPETHVTEVKYLIPGSEADKQKKGKKNYGVLGLYPGRFDLLKGVGKGFPIKKFPEIGAFRLQLKLSAKFPEGIDEVPFTAALGTYLVNSIIQNEVFSVILKKGQEAKIYDVRGRIEDIPVLEKMVFNKKDPDAKPTLSRTMGFRPYNLFDDGTLNDQPRNSENKPEIYLEWVKFESPYYEQWPPKHHTDILFDSELRKSQPEAYVKEVLKRFMTKAFRRPVQNSEVEHFFNIYQIAFKSMKSMEEALKETLVMVLISPDFLYHVDSNIAERKQFQLAAKLSYFLWGTMPDDELIKLAAEKKLDDKNVVQNQVERLLADERSKAFVENFSKQWLSLEKMNIIPVNRTLFPRFLLYFRDREIGQFWSIKEDMKKETVNFVAELIKRNSPVSNIVDSDFAMLNFRLAKHYGVPGVKHADFKPVPVKPEHHLGGLLTQGSILLGNSTGSAPHTIYRAVWLREAILGDEIREPPADVPALVDSAGASAEEAPSIKKLLEKHREVESCHSCHVRLDPWGIPFEHYNAIGQYQPKVPKEGTKVPGYSAKQFSTYEEYYKHLDKLNTVELEAEARVPHGPKVNGMEELKKHLIKDRIDDIALNVIRRFTSYGIGRELTFKDRFAIEKLFNQSKKNGFKMKDMITLVCLSDFFLEDNSK